MAEPNNKTASDQELFQKKVLPIMESVQQDLRKKQLEEYGRHCSSWGAILAAAAGPDGGMSASQAYNDSILYTGEWNSKTVEDYIEMVKAELKKNQITVDAVIEKKMIDHLVKQQMPKSTTDYILRKAAEGTLFYMPKRVRTSPLQDHINKEGDRLHNPSIWEDITGGILSWGANAASTGGFGGFWGQVAIDGTVMATDAIAPGQEQAYLNQQKEKAKQEVATANKRVVTVPLWMLTQMGFDSLDKATDKQLDIALDWATKNAANQRKAVNQALELGERVIKFGTKTKSVTDATLSAKQYEAFAESLKQEKATREERIRNPPIAEAEEQAAAQTIQTHQEQPAQYCQTQSESTPQTSQPQGSTSTTGDYSGWNNLLGSMGLEGIGDTVNHLGVTLAMLPDMLLGLFTGRTKSIGLNKGTMLPLAAIISGTFIKNPLLKIPLMLWGGANLFNKAGQEALAERRQGMDATMQNAVQQQGIQFKRYEDETLDPRIKNPHIEGNVLLMDIDNVPRVVTLPPNAVAAYQAGALPLNTLANAILAKSDQMQTDIQVRETEEASRHFEQKHEREPVRGIR